jgi:hypothetical protein
MATQPDQPPEALNHHRIHLCAAMTTRALLATVSLLASSILHAEIGTKATPPGKPQDQVPEGLAKSDWSSIRAAYEAGRHAFMPVEGGWQARNPGQQLTTRFDGRGFLAQPRNGGWYPHRQPPLQRAGQRSVLPVEGAVETTDVQVAASR